MGTYEYRKEREVEVRCCGIGEGGASRLKFELGSGEGGRSQISKYINEMSCICNNGRGAESQDMNITSLHHDNITSNISCSSLHPSDLPSRRFSPRRCQFYSSIAFSRHEILTPSQSSISILLNSHFSLLAACSCYSAKRIA